MYHVLHNYIIMNYLTEAVHPEHNYTTFIELKVTWQYLLETFIVNFSLIASNGVS